MVLDGAQIVLLVVSGVGLGVSGLIKRSVTQQDRKLDSIVSKIDSIEEKVGDHAEKLATAQAEIRELARRAQDSETQIRDVSVNGCARRCLYDGGRPS